MYNIGMEKRDNIHFTCRTIDGYNLPFNFIISEREAGKSTAVWLDKAYKAFVEGGNTTLVVRRKITHITKAYIDDIQKIINKFTDDNVQFQYTKSSIDDGIVDIYINDKSFMRICALSCDITAIKSLVLLNLKYIIFDEFICNPRYGEKYLKQEANKYMDVYNTFRRESTGLKCYFMGNPYSHFNPYFMFFNVNTAKLKRGAIITDNKSYVIQCYVICEELRAKILAENPLYQFDNDYTKYAFDGQNVNDLNIIIKDNLPPSFKLLYVFKSNNKYIGLYRASIWDNVSDIIYYCQFIEGNKISRRRDIICFDFEELVDHVIMLSPDERYKFQKIKEAMRKRLIAFNSIECYYLLEEIYYNL